MEHVEEKRPAVSKYTMTSREGYTATFTLVILEKTPEPDEVKKETDRYIVFATNVRARSKQDLISKIPDEYKKSKCSCHLGVFCHLPAVDPVTSQGNDPKRSDAPAISDYVVTSKLNGQIFVTCRSKY